MLRRQGLSRLTLVAALLLGCSSADSPSDDAAVTVAPTELDAGSAPQAAYPCDDLGLSDEPCRRVVLLALPGALPEAAGNRYADMLDAARLGFLAFYDPRFSSLPEVRCASCHLPERAFGDGRPRSEVVAGRPTLRNAPSILNAAWSGPYYFWDGRADSLWSQPLYALEHPDEMASSRLAIAHALYDHPIYRTKYEALFGPLPDLGDLARFPASGKPGDAPYDSMPAGDKDAIDRVLANLGKALEAYMRKVATGPSALDRYLAGKSDALSPAEKRGLVVFATRGCVDCHGGPALSDGAFHRMPGSDGSDRGRAQGLALLTASPFNALGPYFDRDGGAAPALPPPSAEDEGALRTPTLRNLARTAPYGHDGRYETVEQLLGAGHGAALDARAQLDLVVFLLALNGSYPARPWSDWPAR